MDDLHRHLFSVLMDREWRHGVAAAVDVTLLGRFYERFADHAVEVAQEGEDVVIRGQQGQMRVMRLTEPGPLPQLEALAGASDVKRRARRLSTT